jgi:hypothetical protein
MSEKLFEVVITGNTIPGMDKAEVVVNFANLFKVDSATAEKMLSGKTRVIKKNVDHKTGFKYHQALRKAGVLAMLKPVKEDNTQTSDGQAPAQQTLQKTIQSNPGQSAQTEQSGAAQPEDSVVTPNPIESELVNKPVPSQATNQGGIQEEPLAEASDSSSLTVADAGEVIPVLKNDQVLLDPDTSSFSVAAPGSKLDELKPAQELVNPDTSQLDIAEVGEQLLEAKIIEPLVIDLSEFSVAEAGSELEELKENKPLLNPDTSKLSLD